MPKIQNLDQVTKQKLQAIDQDESITPHMKANKKWRLLHPDKWLAEKQRYREKNGNMGDKNSGKRWSEDDDDLVMRHSIPDRELAVKIHRSIQAIQIRRSRLNAEIRALNYK